MKHWAKPIVAPGLATPFALVGACWNDGPTPPGRDRIIPGVVVSDTSAVAASVAIEGGMTTLLASASEVEVTYVSLPPGSVPDGESAVITNRRTQWTVTTFLIAGGFDPVAVAARAGDTLETIVSRRDGYPISLSSVVPTRRRPTIVRTVPARGKTDVPLNVRTTIVFSEPLDARTLTPASVQLLRDGAPVAGRLEFADSETLEVAFVPDAPLAARTEYRLVVSEDISDRDGEPLEAPVSIEFTTGTELSAADTWFIFTSANSTSWNGGAQVDTLRARLSPFRVGIVPSHEALHGTSRRDVTIYWTVTAGDGSLDSASTATDASGYASATLTLGSQVGAHTVTASLSTDPDARRITFTAMAVNTVVRLKNYAAGPLPDCSDEIPPFFDPQHVTVAAGSTVGWRFGGMMCLDGREAAVYRHNVTFEDDPGEPTSSPTLLWGRHVRAFRSFTQDCALPVHYSLDKLHRRRGRHSDDSLTAMPTCAGSRRCAKSRYFESFALPRAQRETPRNPATSGPFYWAGFVLVGGR